MKNLEEVIDIYELFLARNQMYYDSESVKIVDDNKERALLTFSCGFNVERTNIIGVEDSATLRCWIDGSDEVVEIDSLEQLQQEFEKIANRS